MKYKKTGAILILLVVFSISSVCAYGSTVESVVTGLDTVWALEWGPDGHLYITERPGKVSKWNGDELVGLSEPPVVEQGESGLMGMTLDPNFSSNSNIYLCYTRRDGGKLENVVEKYSVDGENLTGGKILLDDMKASFIHDGCRLEFGPEGKLLVTMGDSAQASLAQDQRSLNGKVLRINGDGSIPEDNPFASSPVFTLGHRNPQGLDVRPGTDEIYISEHGPDTDDEINRLIAGKNYGWPEVKGKKEEAGFEPALWDWTPTIAPAGIAFLDPNTLYLATLKQSKLHRLNLNNEGEITQDTVVLEGYGRLRSITRGPDGKCLFIGTSNRDGRGIPGDGDDRILKFCP